IPAGAAVDAVMDELARHLFPGDVIVDGGNSYWGDSIRRQRRSAELGIGFVDLGTSGGINGARHGACLMAGGERGVIISNPSRRRAAMFMPEDRGRVISRNSSTTASDSA